LGISASLASRVSVISEPVDSRTTRLNFGTRHLTRAKCRLACGLRAAKFAGL
jgi:hypothetical protein